MAEEEGNAEAPAEGDDKKKGKDGKKRKKTWEEKQQEELKKKKDKFMPFGSDPCVKLRKKGIPRGELVDIKGSRYPWFVKPRKMQDIEKENEAKFLKDKKILLKKGEQRFKTSKKQLRVYLKNKSCEIHKRRVFEANRPPGCEETYEQYLVRKERKKRMKERKKKEEADVAKQIEEEEIEIKEREDGPPKKKMKGGDNEKPSTLETWPGMYVTSVTQDYITLLKYIIEAEFETYPPKKKNPEKKPSTKVNKAVKKLKSFLDVLFTANEMIKDSETSSKKGKNKDTTKGPAQDGEESEQPSGGDDKTEPQTEEGGDVPEAAAAEDEAEA